jgi:hypothetical protein
MMNKTSFMESVAYIKHASGFYGVSSCLSILAQQLKYPVLQQAVEPHFYFNRDIYCAGAGSNNRVVRGIRYDGMFLNEIKGWPCP